MSLVLASCLLYGLTLLLPLFGQNAQQMAEDATGIGCHFQEIQKSDIHMFSDVTDGRPAYEKDLADLNSG